MQAPVSRPHRRLRDTRKDGWTEQIIVEGIHCCIRPLGLFGDCRQQYNPISFI